MLCVLVPVGVCGQVSCFGRHFLLFSFHDVTSMYFTHNTLLVFILVCHFFALYERCVFEKWWFSEVKPTPLRLAYEEGRLFQNQNGPLFLVWKFHSDEVSRPWGCHFQSDSVWPQSPAPDLTVFVLGRQNRFIDLTSFWMIPMDIGVHLPAPDSVWTPEWFSEQCAVPSTRVELLTLRNLAIRIRCTFRHSGL